MAYYGALKYYYLPIRELPSGRGFADLVFLPKRECPEKPALLIELKWDKTAEAAIKQIKKRKYTEALETYKGDILLVGVNYSKKRAKHECVIERKSYERTCRPRKTIGQDNMSKDVNDI
mgnify:FL=1